MRILIYTYGTRGDVQPYVALAVALNARGHHCVLSAPARFAGLAAAHGVEFAGRDDELIRFYLEDPEVQYSLAHQGSAEPGFRARGRRASTALRRTLVARLPHILRDTAAAAEGGADLVVAGHYQWELGQHIAEHLKAPLVMTSLWPTCLPSRRHPSEVVPFGGSLPPLLNRLSYLPLRWFQVGGAEVDRWRADLGLPKRRGRHDRSRTATGEPVPFVHGISPLVVPPAPDWPANAHTSGFWRLPPAPDWSPPPSLADFLDRDPKPVFIGFGSIVSRDPEDTARVIREAVSRAGVRAVVRLEANIDADALGPDVLPAGEAPYDWLFPRVAAIVHGGGVGTVNDALASGVPQVPVPHTSEQEVWCRIAHRLGVATEPFRQRDLDVDRLATALRAATGDEGLARAARSVGERVRAEDGAGTAAALVERYGLDRAATR